MALDSACPIVEVFQHSEVVFAWRLMVEEA